MHKKPLSSRFPHTLQLATDLGKPISFLSVGEAGSNEGPPAITEFAVVVIGPFEFPFAVDGYVNPEQRLAHDDLLRVGQSAKALAAHPTWPELWQEGLGNIVTESLVIGSGTIAATLALIDRLGVRHSLPPARWDHINLLEFFALASGRDWKGNLPMLAEELGVEAPGLARRVVAEPILLARLFEATLATYGNAAVAQSRHIEPMPLALPDPFARHAPTRGRPELRLIEAGTPAAPAAQIDEADGFEGDNVPAMTCFYGGAFTLQEVVDAMLDRLVEQGQVRNYADVIGVLRSLGMVVEKSRDPYTGIVVETAIRAKRRLKGRYYRPNFVVQAEDSAPAAPAASANDGGRKPDLLTRLETQIRSGGYRSLEHQLRLVESDFPQCDRAQLAYAVSMLLDEGRLEHETAADETILNWLTEATRLLLRPGAPVLLKPLMTGLLNSPALTHSQSQRLDYVQLRVALHRLGIQYPAKKKRVAQPS